jgi:hypothetical protein
MFFKRWQWITGDVLDQQEPVLPEITVTQFRIENTGCPQIINITIEHVHSRTQ